MLLLFSANTGNSLPMLLSLLVPHTAHHHHPHNPTQSAGGPQMDAGAVGPPLPPERLHDCITVILSYQNRDGGWATYENKRSFELLEARCCAALGCCWAGLQACKRASHPRPTLNAEPLSVPCCCVPLLRFQSIQVVSRSFHPSPSPPTAPTLPDPSWPLLPLPYTHTRAPPHSAGDQPQRDVWRDRGGLQPRGVLLSLHHSPHRLCCRAPAAQGARGGGGAAQGNQVPEEVSAGGGQGG